MQASDGQEKNSGLSVQDPRVNFCDVDVFFEKYSQKRSRADNINTLVIDPWVDSLLDFDFEGMRVLDVGCGWGELAKRLAERGATVVGFDHAKKMIDRAKNENSHESVTFLNTTMDEFAAKPQSYDLVTSVMAIHYIEDLAGAFLRIAGWLKTAGYLAVMMEHPCVTGSVDYDGDGTSRHTYINHYFKEGPRLVEWLTVPVVKQHHTLEGIFTGLVDAGFVVERLVEPHPGETALAEQSNLYKVENFPHYLGFLARKR